MLAGKVAFITGSDVGRAAPLLFARGGAKVVTSEVDLAGAEETLKIVKTEGGDTAG